MKNIHRPLITFSFLLILSIILSACDSVKESDEDSFTNLDTPPASTIENQPNVKVQNMLGGKILMEIWSGSDIQYIPESHEVKADDLVKITALEIEPLSSTSFVMTNPQDVFVIVGVEFNGRYEYLTEQKYKNLDNGNGLRLDGKGILKPFDNSKCTESLSIDDIKATTDIVRLVENTANDLSSQWQSIKAISNPLYTLLRFAQQIISNQTPLVIAELTNWTVNNGVYTHQETGSNNTSLMLETTFVWGSGFNGHAADELITANIHDPANYFNTLSTSINGDEITFNYTEAKVLAPILGVPVDSNPGSYTVKIIDWLETIRDNYNSLQWEMKLSADHTAGLENLNTELNFLGRPSFNISIDTLNQTLDISQNPMTFSLSAITDTASNSGSLRNQHIIINNWTLKVFPDNDGAKGVVEFEVRDDLNFDYSGFISYNSDVNTPANVFLQCALDDTPILY